MPRARAFLRNPMSFLFTRNTREERVAEYLIREHRSGRRLAEILEDRYVQNRLSGTQQGRLLERQDVIEAVSQDDIEQVRGRLTGNS